MSSPPVHLPPPVSMDSRLPASTLGSSGPGPSQSRKERGAIAAQACELCRSRKQRCDEGKPKCSTCVKMNAECSYREPQPTKKDNTLQEILKRLTSLERKFDATYGSRYTGQTQGLALRSQPQTSADPREGSGHDVLDFFYTPSTKVMFGWPIMARLPDASGAKGKSVDHHNIPPSLAPLEASIDEGQLPLGTECIATGPYSTGSSTPASFVYSNQHVVQPSVGPVLGWETVQPLSKGYFDSYNQLYAIVDEQWFMNHTVGHVMEVAESSPHAALGFLVLALGEVALSGNSAPISQIGGRASGIRGGTADRPPGIQFFNEARRRLGLFMTEISIENLQVLCLTALFFASCGKAGDCWRTIAAANLICQSLASRVPESHHLYETTKRLFYYCCEVTFVLRAEFHLPITDIEHIRDYVGLPDFVGGQSEEEFIASHSSQFRDFSQSQVFTHHFFSNLYTSLEQTIVMSTATGKNLATPEAVREKIRYFNEQLDRWRDLLPQHLAWEDGNFLGFSLSEPSPQILVSSNLMDASMAYPFMSMMQLALARSQYSLGKHMILRYYLYRALHHSTDAIQPEDYRGAAECLKACLKWPITMAPPAMNKRLIPMPFFWSQNVCGALVLLHLSRQHPVLSHIRSTFCGGSQFEYEAAETVELYIQWLRDMKQICAVTERCWRVIRQLYALRD